MEIRHCRFADDVAYDTSLDTWARASADGRRAVVGIDTILAWLGGPFSSVSFKPLGTAVERGKGLGSFEGPRRFDVVRAPLAGRIVRVNESLRADPRLLNHDPYGAGWFAELELLDGRGLADLLPPESARAGLEASIDRLKVRCFAEFPDEEMFEIGTECSAVLSRLDALLAGAPAGHVVHLVSDDPSSEVEMEAWADRTGNALLESRREGNLMHYVVRARP